MTARKEWYSPGSFMAADRPVVFRPDQIEWVVEHYEILIDGRWPQKTSGYVDNPFAPRARRTFPGASFETPVAILAEFHSRIERCGADGELFRCIRCLGYEKERVAKFTRRPIHDIDRVLGRVFGYIIGRRKSRSYQEFSRHHSPRYRGRITNKLSPQ